MIRVVCLFCALHLVACNDSDHEKNDEPNCQEDYVEGRWLYSGTDVSITLEYSSSNEYSSVSSIRFDNYEMSPPPLLTTGFYRLGKQVLTEDGLKVCEITLIVGDSGNDCVEHVYVDDGVLYQGSCDAKTIDFEIPYVSI